MLLATGLFVSVELRDDVHAQTPAQDPNVDFPTPWKRDFLPNQQFSILPEGSVEPQAHYPDKLGVGPHFGQWSKIVYQFWFYDNYEIFIADGDGANPVQLTNHPAADIRPVFDRDAKKVYFASNRDGNFEIYVINSDGTGLKRLTNNPASDSRPAISPDGSRIAFVSGRTGKPEIFVMNADGTNVWQLTYSMQEWAGYDPAWSPDGTRIADAYLSNRGSGYVRITNVNSRQAYHAHTGVLYFIGDLAWAPDGSNRLAFSALRSQDWNFLAVYMFDLDDPITNQYPDYYGEYRPESGVYQDLSFGSWTHDGRFVLLERYKYYLEGEYLYLERVAFEIFMSSLDKTLMYTYPQYSYNMQVDWQILDRTPPISYMNPLPEYTRADNIHLSWLGSTTGLTPDYEYEVYYKTAAANQWSEPSSLYLPEYTFNLLQYTGQKVSFSVRARDEVGRWETWPPKLNQTTATTLFRYLLTGKVVDNRDNTIADAAISIQPQVLNQPLPRLDGRYTAYIADASDLTLQTSSVGFGEVLPTRRNISNDQSYDFVLPPAENLVQNGEFEEDLTNGWNLGGELSVQSSTTKYYAGEKSLNIGTCQIPCLEKTDQDLYLYSDIFFDVFPDGRHLLVGSMDGDGLYYQEESESGEWSPAVKIFSYGSYPFYPARINIFHDQVNGITLCFRYNHKDYCLQKPSSSSWQTIIELPNDGTQYSIAVDRNGTLFAINTNGLRQFNAGTWGELQQVPSNLNSIQLAFDLDNNPIIMGVQQQKLVTATKIAGVWSTLETLFVHPDPTAVVWLRGWRINAHGWGIVSFSGSEPGYEVMIRNPSGQWSDLIPWGTPYSWSLRQVDFENLLIDSFGYLHTYVASKLYFIYRPDVGWLQIASNPLTIEGISIDDSNTVYFSTYSNVLYIYEIQYIASEDHGEINQQVHIPTVAHRPTLSFLYSYENLNYTGETAFRVAVSDGEHSTEVFSTNQTSPWKHQWIDLSSWIGKNVTISFYLDQAVGEPSASLFIDSVSVGDCRTPTVTSVLPSTIELIEPGMVITVYGDNFIEKPQVMIDALTIPVEQVNYVSESSLEVTLLGSLPPGMHAVRVINPGGQAGVMADAFKTGIKTFLPLVNR